MAIRFLQHSKNLEPTNDMLNSDSEACQSKIFCFLCRSELAFLARLVRCTAQRVLVLNALIASIGNQFSFRVNGGLGGSKETQVMRGASPSGNAENLMGDWMHQQLKLQGMAFFLAAVPLFLIFLGAHTGLR